MSDSPSVLKKPIHKKWWFWAILMLVLYSIGSSAKPSAKSATTQPVSLPKAVEPAKPLTTIDKLWTGLDASVKTRNGYDLSFDAETGTATIIETPKTVWDENAIVRQGYANLVAFGKEAFKIDDVKTVKSVVVGSFTDAYGKKANADAVRLTMAKGEFSKYEWGNLYNRPVWEQMKQSSIDYYIHPGLLQEIKLDQLYLMKP